MKVLKTPFIISLFSKYFFLCKVWENLCDWLSGKTKSFILDWTAGLILKYSNFNHPCPFDGQIYVRNDNFSMGEIAVTQFMPSGKYRANANLTDKHRKPLLMIQFFVTVSDIRVERFW